MLTWSNVLIFAQRGNPDPDKKVQKTEEEWANQLTPEQFKITRQKGTEKAFSSEMCHFFESGQYACVCCDTLLFDAEEKFESKSGWPSFTQPVKDNVMAFKKDVGKGMYRIETLCNTCDAHLGHVFRDGPPPSGLRFCINGIALRKINKTPPIDEPLQYSE